MEETKECEELDICETCGKVSLTFQFKDKLQCDECATKMLKEELDRLWKRLVEPSEVLFFYDNESEEGET